MTYWKVFKRDGRWHAELREWWTHPRDYRVLEVHDRYTWQDAITYATRRAARGT